MTTSTVVFPFCAAIFFKAPHSFIKFCMMISTIESILGPQVRASSWIRRQPLVDIVVRREFTTLKNPSNSVFVPFTKFCVKSWGALPLVSRRKRMTFFSRFIQLSSDSLPSNQGIMSRTMSSISLPEDTSNGSTSSSPGGDLWTTGGSAAGVFGLAGATKWAEVVGLSWLPLDEPGRPFAGSRSVSTSKSSSMASFGVLVNGPSLGPSTACERDDITEIDRSAREIGRAELSGSVPSPIPDIMALEIDFLTPRVDNCFCRSDLALAGAFLSRALAKSHNLTEVVRTQSPYRKRSMTTNLAVSRTALSASSRHATNEGTYWRNKRPWFLVICDHSVLERKEVVSQRHTYIS